MNLICYIISIVVSIFAVSGINFDHFIKKNHIWEARFLAIIMIFSMSYLLSHFMIDIINLKLVIK